MSDLSIKLDWHRAEPELTFGKYANAHKVVYNDASELTVDAAPDWGGDPINTNPEQALAASLSSCHMMTFLSLVAKAKWPVAAYSDHAVAHLISARIRRGRCRSPGSICIPWCVSTRVSRWRRRNWRRCSTARIAIASSPTHSPTTSRSISFNFRKEPTPWLTAISCCAIWAFREALFLKHFQAFVHLPLQNLL